MWQFTNSILLNLIILLNYYCYFTFLQALAIIAFRNEHLDKDTFKILLSTGATYAIMNFIESKFLWLTLLLWENSESDCRVLLYLVFEHYLFVIYAGFLDVVLMYGAYSMARGMAISRVFIKFFWWGLGSVFVVYVYVYVSNLSTSRYLFLIKFVYRTAKLLWENYCRQVLQERNKRSSDEFFYRLYILVLGSYAAVRLIFGLLVKLPACHALSEMSDQSFFQFFKWIYQVFIQ